MMGLRRWLRYRRRLAAAVRLIHDKGYDLSPQSFERLKRDMRKLR